MPGSRRAMLPISRGYINISIRRSSISNHNNDPQYNPHHRRTTNTTTTTTIIINLSKRISKRMNNASSYSTNSINKNINNNISNIDNSINSINNNNNNNRRRRRRRHRNHRNHLLLTTGSACLGTTTTQTCPATLGCLPPIPRMRMHSRCRNRLTPLHA